MKIHHFHENPNKAASLHQVQELDAALKDILDVLKKAIAKKPTGLGVWASYSQANFRWCLGLASGLSLRIRELTGIRPSLAETIPSFFGHHSSFPSREFTQPPLS